VLPDYTRESREPIEQSADVRYWHKADIGRKADVGVTLQAQAIDPCYDGSFHSGGL
jgi:hypothetical protein